MREGFRNPAARVAATDIYVFTYARASVMTFACSSHTKFLAQMSRNPTVRLNTSLSGRELRSRQK